MERPAGSALEELHAFLGDWAGTTQWEATPWGPARSAEVAISFARAAAGLAVTASYRHTEADGSHTEGHGVFTADKDRPDRLWYHVNSLGLPPEAPAPAGWHEGALIVERRSERGTARHTFRVENGVLTHSAGLRLGTAGEFTPFMASVCRRVPETSPATGA